jgi:RimJ/RimL family protein N-acetyltransferase
MDGVELRKVEDAYLDLFHIWEQDPAGRTMAAFIGDRTDRGAFDAHWAKLRADDAITNRTILYEGRVAGHIGSWLQDGERHLTYWIAPERWGKGIATEALRQFLEVVTDRPLHASTAGDNTGSQRVLEKAGFKLVGGGRGFAKARGEEIEETFYRLD